MPFVRRRPLLRAAAVGGVAYMGAKAGTKSANAQAEQTGQQQPPPQPAPPPQASAATDAASDRISQLKELADLKASGALTDEEFDREKQRILG